MWVEGLDEYQREIFPGKSTMRRVSEIEKFTNNHVLYK